MKKIPEVKIEGGIPGIVKEPLSDWRVLRCMMAAMIYGEIRHELRLQHDPTELEAADLYKAVFRAVDDLIEGARHEHD